METLVLNASYAPIYRTNRIGRILTMLKAGKAEIVEEYEDRFVKSFNVTLRLPAVVRLIQYVKAKTLGVKFNRANIYQRDKGKCQYCARHVPMSEFTFEHVIPRCQGGQSTFENVVVACTPCNQRKGGRTPEQAGMKLLSVPKRPRRASGNLVFNLTYEKGMPISWKNYLQAVSYWNTELEK